LQIAEIWRYRDLLLLLVYRDFATKYKQTVLGPAWFVIQPLLTSVVFTVVFAGAIRIPTDGVPPMLFYFKCRT
jgi:lipopolysaccharide transport system permease protein